LRWRKSVRELRESLQALLDISPFATDSCGADIHSRARAAIRESEEEL
jgi:hypothetical protein